MTRSRIHRCFGIVSLAVILTSSCDYKPRNQGKSVYQAECARCHMENGQGLGSLIPPVAQADYVKANKADLACLIRYGISGEIKVNGTVYSGEMKGNLQLSEVEISNLVHYILKDLNEVEPYTIQEVKAQLNECVEPVR